MFFNILSWALIVAGSIFLLIGSIGLIRLPDVFARMHAAGIVDTLAVSLLVIGMGIQAGLSLVTVKLGLILLFMFFASPTSTHALAKAAIAGGIKPILHEDRRKKKPKKKPRKGDKS